MPSPDELEIQGRRALFVAKRLERGGGLDEDQLQTLAAQPVEARTRWVRWHAAGSHDRAYANLARAVLGDCRGLVRIDGVLVATTSDREACRLVRLAFDAVGMRAQLDGGGAATIAAGELRKPSAELFSALEEIADHGTRVLGDIDAGRKRKALAKARASGKAPALKGVVSLITTAMRHVGASLTAEYASDKARKRRDPAGYKLSWLWDHDPAHQAASWMETGLIDEFGAPTYYSTPTPIPRHPWDRDSAGADQYTAVTTTPDSPAPPMRTGDPQYTCDDVFDD
jgi:hypothetical protein